MSSFLSVSALHEEGVPGKTIARRLGLDPRTVRRYVRRIGAGDREPRRRAVPRKLDPWRDRVEVLVKEGLSAVQVWQRLRGEPEFDASYESVKRLVRTLRPAQPVVYCRMQFKPGEEAQIDFGDIGRLAVGGRMCRAYLFAMTLCHSRFAYHELTTSQAVPAFLGAIRRGFEFLGGAPARLKPDNLRSAVLINGLGERCYQQDFFRLCRHYGTVPDAARPATPTDKGRVERDIGYAKGNWLRGREFASFDAAAADLASWRDGTANVRLHGTTRRRPVDLFAEERCHLRPLPDEPFEVCTWGRYKVRKDVHIHVLGNHYSVPWRLAGSTVSVRLRERDLTVLADDQVVATHELLAGKGGTRTDPAHLPARRREPTQEIHRRRTMAVREAGPHCLEYLARLSGTPLVGGDQVARLARLVETHGAAATDLACRRAVFFGAVDGAATIERILRGGLHLQPLPGDAPSPVPADRDFGRSLREYDALLELAEVA